MRHPLVTIDGEANMTIHLRRTIMKKYNEKRIIDKRMGKRVTGLKQSLLSEDGGNNDC